YMILDFTNVGSRYIDFTRTITIGPNVEQLTLKGVPGITYILLDIIVANGRTKPLKLILWNMNYMAKSHGVNMYNETLNIEYYGNNSITAGYDKNGNADGYDAIRNVGRTVTINNGSGTLYITGGVRGLGTNRANYRSLKGANGGNGENCCVHGKGGTPGAKRNIGKQGKTGGYAINAGTITISGSLSGITLKGGQGGK